MYSASLPYPSLPPYTPPHQTLPWSGELWYRWKPFREPFTRIDKLDYPLDTQFIQEGDPCAANIQKYSLFPPAHQPTLMFAGYHTRIFWKTQSCDLWLKMAAITDNDSNVDEQWDEPSLPIKRTDTEWRVTLTTFLMVSCISDFIEMLWCQYQTKISCQLCVPLILLTKSGTKSASLSPPPLFLPLQISKCLTSQQFRLLTDW